MKKIILLALFVPYFHHSQIKTELEVFGNSRGSVFDVTNQTIKSYSGIDGSPYLDESFHPITIDGYNKTLPAVRYNAYEDEMEFKNGNNLNYVSKQDDMKIKLTDLGKTYFLTNYLYDGKNTKGYLVEIVGIGKYKLYKKEKIQIVEYNNNTTNTYFKNKNPYFEREKDIFLINDNGTYRKLPKNIKETATLLNISDDESVQKFVKENKINFKNESDLIKFFNFLNSK